MIKLGRAFQDIIETIVTILLNKHFHFKLNWIITTF